MGGRQPTILQIIPKLDTGGAELAVIDMAEAVSRAGGRALVLSEPGRLTRQVIEAGGETIDFPAATKNPLRIWQNAAAITELARREDVALIHARSRAPAWSGLLAARRLKVPFVTTYHGAYKENGALKRTYNSVMARGDAVIANSAFTADLIAQRYGTPKSLVTVIHRGVDPAHFDPARVDAARVAALRTAWGAGPGQRVILHPARLTSWKGQIVVIEAAARLAASDRLGGSLIVMAGDAQGREGYREELSKRIADLGLQGRVHLAGHVSDMPAAYLAAHVTVIASTKPEAFGRTVIEAAAMRCPVIATAIGAPQETIQSTPMCEENQTTGWLVPPADASGLGDQLLAALSLSPAAREAMGARARAHVLSHFTKRGLQLKTLAVYDRLLGTDLQNSFARATPVEEDATKVLLQS